MTIRVELPGLRIVSVANCREHHMVKARRTALHRGQARFMTRAHLPSAIVPTPWLLGPLTVTLTRIGPRRLDDDNLAAGFKAVRDGVADALGIDDGDPRVTWHVAQESAGAGVYGVRIVISSREEPRDMGGIPQVGRTK